MTDRDREVIISEMKRRNDKWDNVISIVADDSISIRPAYTIWTKDWIYFPVTYDSSDWTGSVPRHPDRNFVPEYHGG